MKFSYIKIFHNYVVHMIMELFDDQFPLIDYFHKVENTFSYLKTLSKNYLQLKIKDFIWKCYVEICYKESTINASRSQSFYVEVKHMDGNA